MVAAVQQSSNGVAFEVDIKNPEAAHVMTPGRARLERYAAGERPLPRLLQASGEAREAQSPWSPPKVVAEKARAKNEKKQAVVDKKRKEETERITSLRRSLDEEMDRAEEKRRSSLADASLKAGEHFGKVKARLSEVQRQLAETSAEHQRKLEEALEKKSAAHDAGIAALRERAGQHNEQVAKLLAQHQRQQADVTAEQQKKIEENLAQKGAAHGAGVTERGEKAGKHNEQVAEKVKQHQQDVQKGTDKLREHIREKLEREKPERRTVLNRFSPPATPNGKVEGKAIAE